MNHNRKLPDDDLECYKIGCTFQSADDTMDAYMVGNDRLRDVITQVTVIERTI